jgi:hypothetical protein
MSMVPFACYHEASDLAAYCAASGRDEPFLTRFLLKFSLVTRRNPLTVLFGRSRIVALGDTGVSV